MQDIIFKDETKSIGRNGLIRTSGVSMYASDRILEIAPITSRGDIANCSVAVPLESVYAVVAALTAEAENWVRDNAEFWANARTGWNYIKVAGKHYSYDGKNFAHAKESDLSTCQSIKYPFCMSDADMKKITTFVYEKIKNSVEQ